MCQWCFPSKVNFIKFNQYFLCCQWNVYKNIDVFMEKNNTFLGQVCVKIEKINVKNKCKVIKKYFVLKTRSADFRTFWSFNDWFHICRIKNEKSKKLYKKNWLMRKLKAALKLEIIRKFLLLRKKRSLISFAKFRCR